MLRITREIEQQALANATGLSLSLIEKIEAGGRKPSPRAVARIENFFGQRIFSSPSEYRRRKGVVSAPRAKSRLVSFKAGSCVEFVGSEEIATQFAAECGDDVRRDGSIITFIRPVTLRQVNSPRQKSQQSHSAAPAAETDHQL